MIKQRILISLLLCLLLTAAGCGTASKQQNGNDAQPVNQATSQKSGGQVYEQKSDNGQNVVETQPKDGPDTVKSSGGNHAKPASSSKPAVIVKSTSSVSDQELKATYDEIDKELNSLIKELNNVDTPVECSPDLTDS